MQCECIVEELKKRTHLTKFSNLEKLVRLIDSLKRFAMKLQKSTETYGTLRVAELLKAENYLIQSEQKQFYKE